MERLYQTGDPLPWQPGDPIKASGVRYGCFAQSVREKASAGLPDCPITARFHSLADSKPVTGYSGYRPLRLYREFRVSLGEWRSPARQ